VTTIPDEGEDNFKMPRASVVHMTSTATRPHHMSQTAPSVIEWSGLKWISCTRRPFGRAGEDRHRTPTYTELHT
ncbi:hypothetical protein ALC57_12336, partial [Trachymyrmex cornetzi]